MRCKESQPPISLALRAACAEVVLDFPMRVPAGSANEKLAKAAILKLENAGAGNCQTVGAPTKFLNGFMALPTGVEPRLFRLKIWHPSRDIKPNSDSPRSVRIFVGQRVTAGVRTGRHRPPGSSIRAVAYSTVIEARFGQGSRSRRRQRRRRVHGSTKRSHSEKREGRE